MQRKQDNQISNQSQIDPRSTRAGYDKEERIAIVRIMHWPEVTPAHRQFVPEAITA